ncbi:MAG: B12-binding domain-containing radical SAM protein [Nitrospina sp.]|jgi:anaerobic magnesium-protoporphyrin IX monomethyl ester cyclase|nr:B12-binding domain-containing radical SAM protein [Nitrospina sp.]
MGIKVLFIYPNTFGMNMLPPAIALFSALLKEHGHQVDLFDSTYYQTDYGIDSDGSKAERLNILPFSLEDKGIRMRDTDWREDIKKKVQSFEPDLIAISSTEDMWLLGLSLVEEIEAYITRHKIPVIAGGVFPTFAPEIAIKHRLIDMVCVGEGENAIIDLCEHLGKGDGYNDITNLWVKQKDGSIVKNEISNPFDINKTPIIDIELFEENRLYRPMVGKWYKMMPVETIRGCPYKCAFCNSPDQMTLYNDKTDASFFRKKNINLVYRELKFFKENHGIEYNYFWADTFLSWNNKEFDEFCEMYSEIGLPFWIQTRPETITDYKIKKLAKVGLHRISFGLEHGNEKFRKKLLRREWKNESIIDALKIPGRHGVSFSVNNITGFPTETRELAMDTVELNRNIQAHNQNLFSFVPFHGTPLRKLCEEMDLVEPDTITRCLTDKPMLNQEQYPPEEIEALQKCFVLYVKMPKNRWNDIKKAESSTPEGQKIFQELKAECIDKYMLTIKNQPNNEPHNVADLEYGLEFSS